MSEWIWQNFERLVVIDTETTGIDPARERVIELAAIAYGRSGEEESFDLFVSLPEGRRVPPFIVRLTGITDELLAREGVKGTEAAERLAGMLSGPGTLLAAYNAQFDLCFIYYLLKEAGIVPEYAAGLSLGEYSALQCAGVFDAPTAISLVAFRGQAMANAVQGRPCGMAAVLGMDRESLKAVCQQASDAGVVECTNFNCPGQIVISGDAAAVDKAGELAKAAGAKRVLPLKVSGPFHTSLMAPAGDALREKFKSVDFHDMEIPVLFNCLGREMGEGDTIPALLERQVQSSVYLEDTIRRLADLGVDTVVEIGPGKALSGFVRKTAKQIKCYPVETAQELQAAVAALKGESDT